MGFRASLHGSNPERSMSALGQKQTLQHVCGMSALPPKADKADSSAIGSNVENPRPGLPDQEQRNWPHCEPCVRHHSLIMPGAKAATRADT
jgi:hypothetical protein